MIALAIVGGTVGTGAYWMFGEGGKDVSPHQAIDLADNTIGLIPRISPGPNGDKTVDGPDRIPAETDPIIVAPPSAPEPSAPTPDIQPAPEQRPSARILKQASFIVRFNKGAAIDEHLALYRSDKSAGHAAFARWAAQHPELNGITLDRVNYSGEAILTYTGANDPNPASHAKEIQARLNSLSVVRYADPDYNAFPGKGD